MSPGFLMRCLFAEGKTQVLAHKADTPSVSQRADGNKQNQKNVEQRRENLWHSRHNPRAIHCNG